LFLITSFKFSAPLQTSFFILFMLKNTIMDSAPITNILVEAKREYTRHICNLLVPIVISGIKNIYENCKEECQTTGNQELTTSFQETLKQIPKWNQDVIDQEYDRILKHEDCDLLDDLVKAVFIFNIKILSVISNNNKPKKVTLEIPSTKRLIHRCYLKSSKDIIRNPFLFDDMLEDYEYRKNMKDVEKIVTNSIDEAIRSLVPVRSILMQYMEKEDIEEEDIEQAIEDVHHSPKLPPKEKKELKDMLLDVEESNPHAQIEQDVAKVHDDEVHDDEEEIKEVIIQKPRIINYDDGEKEEEKGEGEEKIKVEDESDEERMNSHGMLPPSSFEKRAVTEPRERRISSPVYSNDEGPLTQPRKSRRMKTFISEPRKKTSPRKKTPSVSIKRVRAPINIDSSEEEDEDSRRSERKSYSKRYDDDLENSDNEEIHMKKNPYRNKTLEFTMDDVPPLSKRELKRRSKRKKGRKESNIFFNDAKEYFPVD